MRTTLIGKRKLVVACVFTFAAFAAETPVDRWARALGGRDKLAGIKSIYREATLQFGEYHGTIKVWHTADGKYRKEEQIATLSTTETFDGTTGMIQQGVAPPHTMSAPELQTATSERFANSNSLFFVFFPERRRGTLEIEGDDTMVLKPEGGIDWHVTLDRDRWLPKTMVHNEGNQTITVTFSEYELVDGIIFEKEIHRSAGVPGQAAVIRFTKTVLNPPIDDSLFSIETKKSTSAGGNGEAIN